MSRHHFEVATWVAAKEVATWKRDVATWLSSSRLDLMSRHHVDVATWVASKEVATWRRDVAERGLCRLDVTTSLRGRDMGSGVDKRDGVAT